MGDYDLLLSYYHMNIYVRLICEIQFNESNVIGTNPTYTRFGIIIIDKIKCYNSFNFFNGWNIRI